MGVVRACCAAGSVLRRWNAFGVVEGIRQGSADAAVLLRPETTRVHVAVVRETGGHAAEHGVAQGFTLVYEITRLGVLPDRRGVPGPLRPSSRPGFGLVRLCLKCSTMNSAGFSGAKPT